MWEKLIMDKKFLKLSYQLLLTISIFILISCVESNQTNSNQKPQESSLDYVQKSSIITRSERIEGAWTTPQLLGTELANEFSNSNFSGPSLSFDSNSNGFAIWRLDGILNNSDAYQSRTSVRKHESVSIGWINDSSMLSLDANFASFPDIQTHESLGISYALWSSNNLIFLRAYEPLNGWKNAVTIASTPFTGNLYISNSGDAIIYWPSTQVDGTWTLNIRHYIYSSNTLTPEMKLHRPALNTTESVSMSNITAAQQYNNNSLFVWRENTSDTLTNNLISSTLNSAVYDSQAGWSIVKTISGLVTNAQIEKIALATSLMTNNAELILLYPSSNLSDSLGVSFSYENSIWQPSSSILSSGPGFRKNVSIKSNRKGDIIVAWSELLFAMNGHTNQISVKRYAPSTGWGNIEVVSDILPFVPSSPGFNSLHLDYPAVTLNENGNAAIAWVDNTQAIPEIYINHYSPTTRWGTQQLIATNQGTVNDELKIHLDENNKSSVMWAETKQTSLREEHNIWISSYSLPGNVVSPPANGQNPTPTAGLPEGHALITSGCIGCHDGVTATSQPTHHIQTTAECNACHSPIAWRPVIVVDHSQVIGRCESCHNGTVASGKPLTHFATSNLCAACHSTVLWLPAIVLDHSQVPGTCNSCHNGILAVGKSTSHVQSSEQCESCHSVNAWLPLLVGPPTTQPPPQSGLPLDHVLFTSNCISCHNGTTASTKNTTHILTTDVCSACHSPFSWLPAFAVSHVEVIGICKSCHNNLIARGKSPFHIATVGSCDSCHSTNNWLTDSTVFDHSQVMGSCVSCHNGVTASGKSISHILTSERCEACHAITAWLPLIVGLPPQLPPETAIPQSHNLFTDNCISCHNNVSASGKSAAHMKTTDTCQACHSNTLWIPVASVDHSEVLGPCLTCHNGIIAVSKSPFHIPTTTACENCHSTTSWFANPTTPGNPNKFDHTQALGSCESCHNGVTAVGKSFNHIPSSNLCEACHSSELWTPILVDHNEVIGSCESCHTAPLTHSRVGVATGCDNCHSAIIWSNPINALPISN